jgi:hypothetical protein
MAEPGQLPEESLAVFKRYIARLFSVNIADPNVGVTFADDALGAVNGYVVGRLTWQDFVWRCEALLEDSPE